MKNKFVWKVMHFKHIKKSKKDDKKSGGRLLGGAAVGLLLGGPIGTLMGAAAGTAANGVNDLTKGKKLDEKYPDNYNTMLQFEKYYKKMGRAAHILNLNIPEKWKNKDDDNCQFTKRTEPRSKQRGTKHHFDRTCIHRIQGVDLSDAKRIRKSPKRIEFVSGCNAGRNKNCCSADRNN